MTWTVTQLLVTLVVGLGELAFGHRTTTVTATATANGHNHFFSFPEKLQEWEIWAGDEVLSQGWEWLGAASSHISSILASYFTVIYK